MSHTAPLDPADSQVTSNTTENDKPTATAVPTINDEEPIPFPASSDRRAGHVFRLLGLPYRDDRKPVHNAVHRVWNGWAFSTGKLSWSEVPEEHRLELEESLRQELATLDFTESEHEEAARKIRRCQEWLPRFLLAEKHRLRRRGAR